MSEGYDVELRLVSDPRYLCVARATIGAAVEKVGLGPDTANEAMLAVDEAMANIIRHGYDNRTDRPIWVRFRPTDGPAGPGFEIVIDDEGRQVDPHAIRGRPLEEVRPGGLGVHLIRHAMDSVHYSQRPTGGMRLVMTRSGKRTRREDRA